MLSVMTVVLPQHSKHAAGQTTLPPTTSSSNTKTTSIVRSAAVVSPHCQSCDYRCGVENASKNSMPMRCPYLKVADNGCRHQPPRNHPITMRECESLREAACFWKEKYDRLYENQRRLQKINENLEEKLLRTAEKFESEKSDLTRDVSDLTSRLVEARLTIAELEEENEQYRNDCNIAVRLLQCKPSSFVAHKFNSLPADFQAKVKRHLSRPPKDRLLMEQCVGESVRTIKVSVPALPSANMVYSVNKSDIIANISGEEPDHVSAAIIAKVLEERSLERASLKKQRTEEDLRSQGTQTDFHNNRQIICRCHPKQTTNRHPDLRTLKEQALSSSTETAI